MGNDVNSLNREEIRNIAVSYLAAKMQKQEFEFGDLVDTSELNEICINSLNAQLKGDMDFIKLVMFIYALKLKEEFLKRAFEIAKEKNIFFQYTINIYWRKDPLTFNQIYRTNPELSGHVDGIWWCKKIGRKRKTTFSIERIPVNSTKKKYTERSFSGASNWEKELIMEYEEKFAIIRSVLSDIKEIKTKTNFMLGRIEKLKTNIDYSPSSVTDEINEEELL